MYAHKSASRRVPDRRGGKMNQPRPQPANTHHQHIMVAWGSDPRYTRCQQAGCYYAEVNDKPVTGRKERSREWEQPEMFLETM